MQRHGERLARTFTIPATIAGVSWLATSPGVPCSPEPVLAWAFGLLPRDASLRRRSSSVGARWTMNAFGERNRAWRIESAIRTCELDRRAPAQASPQPSVSPPDSRRVRLQRPRQITSPHMHWTTGTPDTCRWSASYGSMPVSTRNRAAAVGVLPLPGRPTNKTIFTACSPQRTCRPHPRARPCHPAGARRRSTCRGCSARSRRSSGSAPNP